MSIRICGYLSRMWQIVAVILLVMASNAVYAAKFDGQNDVEPQGKAAIVTRGEVDLDAVRRMYLGQQRNYVAVNLPEGSDTRERFERNVIGRSPAQMKAHWSRLVFTGRAWELNVLKNDEDVVSFVRSNMNAIGYISDVSKADGLYIVLQF